MGLNPPGRPVSGTGKKTSQGLLQVLALLLAVALAACTNPANLPSNLPLTDAADVVEAAGSLLRPGSTAIFVALSGGGARSAAFGYGVLSALAEQRAPEGAGRTLADDITVAAGVSGGGILAAYLALHGPAALPGFKRDYLDRDAEASLRTAITPVNLLRGYRGGVNDLTGLASWLDEHLYHGATLGALERAKGPRLLLHATELYNRAPFSFERSSFRAICSDYRSFPLSQAVAASAAVPVIFAPIVLTNFRPACPTATAVVDTPAERLTLAAQRRETQTRYATAPDLRYLKLLDGGLVDNLAVRNLARSMSEPAPAPLSPANALRVRRIIVIVADASLRTGGDMSIAIEGPEAPGIISASIDAMIDTASRTSLDLLERDIGHWRQRLIRWRCATRPKLDCGWLAVDLIKLSLADIHDPETASRILKLHNRLSLKPDEVNFLAGLGRHLLVANPLYRRILAVPRRWASASASGPAAPLLSPGQ